MGPIYYREANGALLVYDVTSAESLKKVRDWVRELNKMLGKQNVRLAIVGNKLDLLNLGPGGNGGGCAISEQRAVQASAVIQEAIQLSEELQNARHYLASAKLNQGLGELFVSLSRRMIEQHKRLAGARRENKTVLASSRLVRGMHRPSDLEGNEADHERGGLGPRVIDGRCASSGSGGSGGACKC